MGVSCLRTFVGKVAVTEGAIASLKPMKNVVHTLRRITMNNYYFMEKIRKALEANVYFYHTYSSWGDSVSLR